jgi:hypothetical protein
MEGTRFHQTAGHIPPPGQPEEQTPYHYRPSAAIAALLTLSVVAIFLLGFLGHGAVWLFSWAWNLWP